MRTVERLEAQLAEAEETLCAIRSGEVDALVVRVDDRQQVFTLRGADYSYRLLIETMNEGALTLIADGTILYANRRFAEMAGMPLQKVIGAALRDFVAIADRAPLAALLEQARAGSAKGEVALRAGGALVPVLVSASTLPVEGAEHTWSVVVTDLTDQKRNEAMVAAEQLARSILDQAAEAIVVCDGTGQVVRASQAAHLLCKCNPLRRPFERVFPLRHAAAEPELPADVAGDAEEGSAPFDIAAILRGNSLQGAEAVLDRGTGDVVNLLVSAGPLWGADDILGCVVTLTDITARKRLEVELRRRAEALAEADRRKDEFLAMLAHELRNPLAPILNAAQVLRLSAAAGSASQRASTVVERQVNHMARLVDDLLEVSRITRGKLELRTDRALLQTVVQNALQSCRPLMEAHEHAPTVALPPEPIWLRADTTRLEQVLVNLLNNAAKYTPAGGRISLVVERVADRVQIRVRDTGRGIAPDVLPHVFELFVQSERSSDRAEGGLGIGLTLVKRLVEMHHGTVTAHSDGIDRGSEFVVSLPVLPSGRAVGAPERARVAPDGHHAARILVVEDNLDAAETMKELLLLLGHDVQVAHDGPAALALAAKFRPEVVLLDLGLPRMDGFEVARRLREDAGLDEARLVAVTGYGQEGDRSKSREAGFDDHLVKPVDLAAVKALLAGIPHDGEGTRNHEPGMLDARRTAAGAADRRLPADL